jgi:tripartite-type tricarboxylate transporter receptor subunit TctC
VVPDVPTLDEAGLRGYEASTYIGVLAPAGTPAPVVTRLNEALRRVLSSPEVLERLRALGTEPGAGSPEAFAKTIREALGKWREVAARANLKSD